MPTRKGDTPGPARTAPPGASPSGDQTPKSQERSDAPASPDVTSATSRTPRRNALFPIGVNYYPLDAETQGPDEWYARDVVEDFAAMSEARCSLVRLFVSWRVLEPQVGQYDEEAVERLQDIVATAREAKLQVIVSFFADDRLAEMLDVTWAKKRDPRTDPYLIQRQVALVQKIVNKLRADTALLAWDLGNESFFSGFSSADELDEWVRTLREAIREVDPDRPIIVSIDPETLFRHSGVDPRATINRCEFAVSHSTSAYRAYAAQGPITSGVATYLDSFLLRSAARDLPVLLDDAGVSSLDQSQAEEAAFVRTVLYSGLMNRGAGVVLRRWRDLDTERREPYFRDPFEILVGVADSEGRPKPSLGEVSHFARVAARIDLRRYSLVQERAAVLVPDERYSLLPDLAGLYDPRSCLQSFVIAKQAHIPVTIARESDGFDAYSVLILPSAFALAEDTWARLGEFVQGGGSVVLSYGGGDAHSSIRDIFGVEFLGDGGGRESLACRVAQADVLGALRSFDTRVDVPNYALLGHGGATVIATDAKGSPLVVLNQLGQGRAAFISFPVERVLAQSDPWAASDVVSEMLRSIYGAVARSAGCGAPVRCDVPEVEVAMFAGDDDDILVLLSHLPGKVTANVETERTIASIADVRGGSPVPVSGRTFGVPLGPNGTAALRLSYE